MGNTVRKSVQNYIEQARFQPISRFLWACVCLIERSRFGTSALAHRSLRVPLSVVPHFDIPRGENLSQILTVQQSSIRCLYSMLFQNLCLLRAGRPECSPTFLDRRNSLDTLSNHTEAVDVSVQPLHNSRLLLRTTKDHYQHSSLILSGSHRGSQ